MRLSRKQIGRQRSRGFESLPLRQYESQVFPPFTFTSNSRSGESCASALDGSRWILSVAQAVLMEGPVLRFCSAVCYINLTPQHFYLHEWAAAGGIDGSPVRFGRQGAKVSGAAAIVLCAGCMLMFGLYRYGSHYARTNMKIAVTPGILLNFCASLCAICARIRRRIREARRVAHSAWVRCRPFINP